MKKMVPLMLVAAFATLVLTSATTAVGGEEEEEGMTAQGACSMRSIWALTIEREVGLKFEAHLETGVPDQTWRVIVGYNHHVLLTAVEETEEDGCFELVKVENNAQGQDVATLHALNLDTGEFCWGKLTVEL